MPPLLTIMGALALVGGSVGFFALPYGLSAGIKSIINLDEKGIVFSAYMKPSKGTSPAYYLYAIKNPSHVLKGGKASFDVKGPFKFETYVVKNIKFSDEGQKVSFVTSKSYAPSEIHSADLDEEMWLVNPVALSVTKMTRKIVLDRIPFKRMAEPLIMNGMQAALDGFGEEPIERTTPRRMLVGRRIPIFEMLALLGERYQLGDYLPGKIFGIVSGGDEAVEIWTGVGRTKNKFGDVSRYKYQDKMTAWSESRCNQIVGTNGEFYKPFPMRGKPIVVFIGGLCRSFTLDPIGDQPVKTESGAIALEYELSRRTYMGARSKPSNACFCEDLRTYDCQYDGLLAMGPCISGAPLYLSRAGFEGVDSRIRDLVDWQSMLYVNDTEGRVRVPDRQQAKIDPITGIPLELDLTVMASFKLVRNPKVKALATVQPLTYLPLFTVAGSFKIPLNSQWIIVALQKIDEYQSVAMMGAALTGLGTLLLSSLLG